MKRSTRVEKCCKRCGWVGKVRVRVRHCHQPRFGRGSYACWGDLELTEKPRKGGAAMTRPQDIAQKKLEHARQQVTKKTKAMKRLATSLRFWESRATYYAKRSSMTDDEVAAEKQKRVDAQARRQAQSSRRSMAVGGLKGV